MGGILPCSGEFVSFDIEAGLGILTISVTRGFSLSSDILWKVFSKASSKAPEGTRTPEVRNTKSDFAPCPGL